MAEGYQVVNFDARGHGESDWSRTGAYRLSDRVADLMAITGTLGQPFLLVGASLGGATAISAVHEGLRPAGLAMVDIVPEPDNKVLSVSSTSCVAIPKDLARSTKRWRLWLPKIRDAAHRSIQAA